MKTKIFTLLFIAFVIITNAQDIPSFTYGQSHFYPSGAVDGSAGTTFDPANMCCLYQGHYSINALNVGSMTIPEGGGSAIVEIHIPPYVMGYTFSVDDPVLAAGNPGIRMALIGEFPIGSTNPTNYTQGDIAESDWAYIYSANRNYHNDRDVNFSSQESIARIAIYNGLNYGYGTLSDYPGDIPLSDIDITWFIAQEDSANFVNWANGVTCTETITAGEISGSQTICDGDDPDIFTSISSATGNTDLAYQWQYSEDQTIWIDAVGETNETWDLAAVDYGYTTQTDLYGRRKASDCSGDIYSNIITLTIDVCTGIDNTQQTSFSIYPNPATSQLTINNVQLTADNIKILDITGKVVLVSSLRGGTTNQSVDISDLQNGVYFVKVGSVVKEFIKK